MAKKKGKIIVLLFLMTLLLIGCSKVSLNLKRDNVEVEYGENISLNASDYLNNDEKILSKVNVNADIKNEEGKAYPSIGEYSISFVFEDDDTTKADVKVIVKDTTAPVFKDIKEEYEIEEGETLSVENFNSNVEDLSDVTITIDDSNVDYKTAGTYIAMIKAVDTSGNETSKKVGIVIKEKEKVENVIVDDNKEEISNVENNYTVNQSENSSVSNNTSSNTSSNNSTSNSTSSTVNQPTTPTVELEPPKVQEEVKNYNVGNSGMVFDTKEEARNYAEDYLDKNYETVGGYLLYSTYDKYTINFDYY